MELYIEEDPRESFNTWIIQQRDHFRAKYPGLVNVHRERLAHHPLFTVTISGVECPDAPDVYKRKDGLVLGLYDYPRAGMQSVFVNVLGFSLSDNPKLGDLNSDLENRCGVSFKDGLSHDGKVRLAMALLRMFS